MENFISWQQQRKIHLKNKTNWGPSGLKHPQINELFVRDTEKYNTIIDEFLLNINSFELLGNLVENGYCSSVDAFILFNMIKKYKPKTYFEIGSGYSTLITRRSSEIHKQALRIVSIDPKPRAEVDKVCDKVVRSCFESITSWNDVDILAPADIVFIDSSHISEGYSDVSMIFSSLLPRLKKGTIVHVHDIHLPFNYIEEFKNWNEQYFLIPYLLTGYFEVLFPTFFVCHSRLFDKKLDSFEGKLGLNLGASIWLIKN